MKCPGCKADLLCDCPACLEGRKEQDGLGPVQITQAGGAVIDCPLCGFSGGRAEWIEAMEVADHTPD